MVLTSCLIPAPASTETCQRNTVSTTCRAHRSLSMQLSVPPSPSDTALAPAFLHSLTRRGVCRKREEIPPEETGSFTSGSTAAPQRGGATTGKGNKEDVKMDKSLSLT